MKKPRKAYRPKPVLPNPLASMRPLPIEKRRSILLSFHTSLATIERGQHPGIAEWRDLADLVNICETFMRQGKLLRDEIAPSIGLATEAMCEAGERFKQGRAMRLSGAGLVALRFLIDVHDQCLEGFTEREVALAVAETQRVVLALQRSRPQNVTQL